MCDRGTFSTSDVIDATCQCCLCRLPGVLCGFHYRLPCNLYGFMIHRFCADVRKEGMGVASDDWQIASGKRAYAWNLKMPHNRFESHAFRPLAVLWPVAHLSFWDAVTFQRLGPCRTAHTGYAGTHPPKGFRIAYVCSNTYCNASINSPIVTSPFAASTPSSVITQSGMSASG